MITAILAVSADIGPWETPIASLEALIPRLPGRFSTRVRDMSIRLLSEAPRDIILVRVTPFVSVLPDPDRFLPQRERQKSSKICLVQEAQEDPTV